MCTTQGSTRLTEIAHLRPCAETSSLKTYSCNKRDECGRLCKRIVATEDFTGVLILKKLQIVPLLFDLPTPEVESLWRQCAACHGHYLSASLSLPVWPLSTLRIPFDSTAAVDWLKNERRPVGILLFCQLAPTVPMWSNPSKMRKPVRHAAGAYSSGYQPPARQDFPVPTRFPRPAATTP